MAQQKIWILWNDANYDFVWGSNDYIWSEVFVLINVGESFSGGAGGLILHPKRAWKDIEKQFKRKKFSEEDTKKFLEIVVRVNGLNKTEVREINKIKKMITVDHIKKVITEFAPSVQVIAVDVKKT